MGSEGRKKRGKEREGKGAHQELGGDGGGCAVKGGGGGGAACRWGGFVP